MKKPKVLLIEPELSSKSTIEEYLRENYHVLLAHDADTAIDVAAVADVDLVILELSLGSHSGMEFLFEFRTYTDWLKIPVVIYTNVKLSDDILLSRSWEKLGVYKYLYKPESSLAELSSVMEKTLNIAVV